MTDLDGGLFCPVHEHMQDRVQRLEDSLHELDKRMVVLENVRALAWKWGAGAGAAIGLIVAVWHAIWEMIGK